MIVVHEPVSVVRRAIRPEVHKEKASGKAPDATRLRVDRIYWASISLRRINTEPDLSSSLQCRVHLDHPLRPHIENGNNSVLTHPSNHFV